MHVQVKSNLRLKNVFSLYIYILHDGDKVFKIRHNIEHALKRARLRKNNTGLW